MHEMKCEALYSFLSLLIKLILMMSLGFIAFINNNLQTA